jgi:pimeloyl-ACP methyl ester carboxylesterase
MDLKKSMPMAMLPIAGFAVILAAVHHTLNRGADGKLELYASETNSGQTHTSGLADINGVRIYYKTYGSGRPLLVLHGGGGFIEQMHYQIKALAASRLVIAPDSRAHGRSTDSDAPLSYAQMADDALKLLDQLRILEVDIVGWSDGGIVGLHLAMHHPERVRRLVAIGANYDVDGLIHKPVFNGKIPSIPAFYKRNAADPAHWPVFYEKLITMQQTQPHYSIDELNKIKAPTLVMAGEFDEIRRKHTDQLAKAIPAAREIIIEGGTHSVPLERPETVNAYITSFLDEE